MACRQKNSRESTTSTNERKLFIVMLFNIFEILNTISIENSRNDLQASYFSDIMTMTFDSREDR
jgi:hypothetical protein